MDAMISTISTNADDTGLKDRIGALAPAWKRT
jgi:hypothetical protein